MGKLCRPPFCTTALLIGSVATLLARDGLAQDQGTSKAGQQLQHSPESIIQLLAQELHKENERKGEPLMAFYEFQDLQDLDCYSRLVHLMNATAIVQREITEYHTNVTGVAGLFWHLLHSAPDENSWIWLMIESNERLVHKIHHYLSLLMVMALDQHSCLTSEVRPIILDAVVKWKKLHVDLSAMLWNGFAFGLYADVPALHEFQDKLGSTAMVPGKSPQLTWEQSLIAGNNWMAETREWFNQYTGNLYNVLSRNLAEVRPQAEGPELRLHHQDEQGMFVPYEYLRRKTFGQWALDKGLLRGLLRYVWQPQYDTTPRLAIADFGAGGGQYSTWLNETGLVDAFAFDGTKQATEASDGAVQEINLIEDLLLWRTFDWVMCLEVGEHIPKQDAGTLLRNIRQHAKKGIVMSWSNDWEGIGHVNCLPKEEFIATVESATGFLVDRDATKIVADGCEIEYIGRTVAVFRAPS